MRSPERHLDNFLMSRLLLLLLAALPSCAYIPRPASVPVKTIISGDPASSELIVFLPGRWSLPTEFEREGFFEIARKKWPLARLAVPDLHLGYYKNESMPRRLHEDVILPARKSGITAVRLIGVSMGGLGALIYDIEHPGQVDEIYLLAPFLGQEEVLLEIRASGGLEKWQPGKIAEKDFSRRLWMGLREKWMDEGQTPCGLSWLWHGGQAGGIQQAICRRVPSGTRKHMASRRT